MTSCCGVVCSEELSAKIHKENLRMKYNYHTRNEMSSVLVLELGSGMLHGRRSYAVIDRERSAEADLTAISPRSCETLRRSGSIR